MRIALEEHFIVDQPAHVDRWLTLIPTVPKEITAKINRPLCDLGEVRIAAMAEANIDFAVLSNVGTVQGALDAASAMTLARQANDRLADRSDRRPLPRRRPLLPAVGARPRSRRADLPPCCRRRRNAGDLCRAP